jgi:hypothetical protein
MVLAETFSIRLIERYLARRHLRRCEFSAGFLPESEYQQRGVLDKWITYDYHK